MTLSSPPPDFIDVERFGNILVSAWAPPSHKNLAGNWLSAVVASFIGSRQALYLLGHRPGRLPKVPVHALSPAARALLQQLIPEPRLGPLHRLPQEAAEASIRSLASGDLTARWSVVDEPTGMSRVESAFLGRPLVLTSASTVAEVVGCTAATPPLQVNASCLTHPEAGLRQPDARWIRSTMAWTGDRVATTWLGNSGSLCIMGGRDALLVVHSALTALAAGDAVSSSSSARTSRITSNLATAMSQATRDLILLHWSLANERRWEQFAQLLAPDLSYEAPQSREYIETGHGYFEMFRTWPGDWKASIKSLTCENNQAVCVIDFEVGNDRMTGISIFEIRDGLICKVTDYWPEPYEPPPRATEHMKRRPHQV